MTPGATSEQPRLYGNWRPERGWGIGSLSTGQTLTGFVAVLAPLLSAYLAPRVLLPLSACAVVVIALLVVRISGSTAAEVITRRVRFHAGRARGWTELSAGVLVEHPRGTDLPGVLAPLVPLDVDDGRGGRHALVWDRRGGTLSAVLRCAPVGLDLADREQADVWVACWGAWLADLGYQPLIRHVAVTVDTAPTGGGTVGDYVAAHRDPRAPELAGRVMAELVALTPAAAAEVDIRLTLTLDPNRATPRPGDLLGAVTEVARWLPGLETGLTSCGVALLGRADIGWLTARIRAAFDPAARVDLARDTGHHQLLEWAEAGPIAGCETWEGYRHDSGTSVTWALREAPRQAVAARVLTPLLAPGCFPRRVTLLYQPYPADQAAAQVEREVTAGQIRRAWAVRTKRDETQRERDDRARALQAAQEEAQGAGVGRLTVYVTTTVTHPDDLPAAVADVEQRAGQAKLRLRRMRGAQAAGFGACLGVGVNPAELAARRTGR